MEAGGGGGGEGEGMDYRSVGAALTRMRKRMSKDAELKARYERIRRRLETEA